MTHSQMVASKTESLMNIEQMELGDRLQGVSLDRDSTDLPFRQLIQKRRSPLFSVVWTY